MTGRDDLLRTHLAAMVPLRIRELREATPEQLTYQAGRYRSTEDWHDSGAFSAGAADREAVARLTSTLAALAYAEGGVDFFGMHWCTDHAHCLAVRGVA